MRRKLDLTLRHVKRQAPIFGPLLLASIGVAIVREDTFFFVLACVWVVFLALLIVFSPERWFKEPDEQRKVNERMARKPVIGWMWRKSYFNLSPDAVDLKELQERDAKSPPPGVLDEPD